MPRSGSPTTTAARRRSRSTTSGDRENFDSGAGWAIATTRDPFAAANPSPNTQAVVVNNNNTINGESGSAPRRHVQQQRGRRLERQRRDTTSSTGPANQLATAARSLTSISSTSARRPHSRADQNSFTGFVFSNNTLGTRWNEYDHQQRHDQLVEAT